MIMFILVVIVVGNDMQRMSFQGGGRSRTEGFLRNNGISVTVMGKATAVVGAGRGAVLMLLLFHDAV